MVETNIDINKGINSKKWLVLGIVLLVLLVVVFSLINRQQGGPQEGAVVIKAGGATLGTFTADDLRKMPAEEKKLVVLANCDGSCANSSGNNSANNNVESSEHNYTGTLLSGVLESIEPGLTQKYNKVITRGADYYSQVLEMSEVLQPGNVYIAYADDGKPLQTRAGGEGGLQLLICNDKTGQRSTNWLVSLELQQ